jgi:hypothetical protein
MGRRLPRHRARTLLTVARLAFALAALTGAARAEASPPPAPAPQAPASPAPATPADDPPRTPAAAPTSGGPGADVPASDAPASGVPSAGLAHEAISGGRRGVAIEVIVGVQSDFAFERLVLGYRRSGGADFHHRELVPIGGGSYRAEIPAEATRGASVSYYVEALDAEGAPVAGRGSAESALVVSLSGPLPDETVASAPPDEDAEDDATPPRRFFFAALVGSGAGWATGNGDTNADASLHPSAFALARLGHLAPEIGVWWRSWLMLSVQGRFQAVTGTTDVYAADGRVYHAATYAAAVFAKATWLAAGRGVVHPFFSLAAGGGKIRHVVTFNDLGDCGANHRQTCVDTIAAGPVAAGPGGGILADLGGPFAGVFQLNTQVTFPAYTFNVDANLGIAARF